MRSPLYFIALMPPKNINLEIEDFKKEIKQKFGISHALKLPAHLTLKIPFRMVDNQVNELIPEVEAFCTQRKAFQVKLNGFGKFSKQVVFVNVENHQPLLSLHQNLLKLISKKIALQAHEIASKLTPHITIATRDLKRSDFYPVWRLFEARRYEAYFIAEKISLFRHNGTNWEVLENFYLED